MSLRDTPPPRGFAGREDFFDCPLPDVPLGPLACALRDLPGVVDSGLFLGFAPEELVGDGEVVRRLG